MEMEQAGIPVLEKGFTSSTQQEAGSNSDRDLKGTGVPADMIEGVWKEVGQWIEKALSYLSLIHI